MSQKTLHCIIDGRVQGVYFRVTTRNKARELNINGWVRNCSNGKVELKATGSDEQLQALIDWIPAGVSNAVVDNISCKFIAHEQFIHFEVIATF